MSLSTSLTKRHVEPGFDHPEEETIVQTIEDHSEDAPAFFASIILSTEAWRGDLLRLLARAPVEHTQPWAIAIAAAALHDEDTDVREAAISALEIWGGAEAKEMLESHRDPQAWLAEYAHRVAKEIG
jgi:hypothetical protein